MKIIKTFALISIPFIFLSCKTTEQVQVIEEKTESNENKIQDDKTSLIIEETVIEEVFIPKVIEKTEEKVEEEVIEEIFIPKKKEMPKIDMTKWRYSQENKVYFQLDIPYCEKQTDTYFERLSIYVPEKYFIATKNNDETFTVKSTTEKTAYVLPLYSEKPNITYDQKSKIFTRENLVYIHAGYSNTTNSSAITGLKAAIRFIKYNKDFLPNGTDDFFVYGNEEYGALACSLGVSEDAPLCDSLLNSMEAAKTSDEIKGIFVCNPTICKENNFEEIEFTKDDSGICLSNELENEQLSEDYKNRIENSLNEFLSETNFPYKSNLRITHIEEIEKPNGEDANEGMFAGRKPRKPKNKIPNIEEEKRYNLLIEKRNNELLGIYETPFDYVEVLNMLFQKKWLEYDGKTNTVKVISIPPKTFVDKSEDFGSLSQIYNPFYFLIEQSDSKKCNNWKIESTMFQSNVNNDGKITLTKDYDFSNLLKDSGCNVDFKANWEEKNSNMEKEFINWINDFDL